jgi:hypothetical protein
MWTQETWDLRSSGNYASSGGNFLPTFGTTYLSRLSRNVGKKPPLAT